MIRQVYFQNSCEFSRFPQGDRIQKHYRGLLNRKEGPIIVDAGANIGVASRYFFTKFQEARVVAIELDPNTVAVCRLNTAMLPQIEVYEAAIGSESGKVMVESFEGHAWVTRTHSSNQGLEVATIPELLERNSQGELFIVKVDIEGFESNLFSSNTEWIDDTFVILVEPHDWMFPDKGTSQLLQQAMSSRGPDLIASCENLIWIKR